MEKTHTKTDADIKNVDHSIDLTIDKNVKQDMFDKWVGEIDLLRTCVDRILDNEQWGRNEIIKYLMGKAAARIEAAMEINENILDEELKQNDDEQQ